MAGIEDLKNERLKKLNDVVAKGDVPYPAVSARTHTVKDFLATFDSLTGQTVTLAGRVMVVRGGKSLFFADLFDGTDKVQFVLKEDEGTSAEVIKYFTDTIDTGDFVDVTGVPFVTRTGQHSILVHSVKLIAKSLLPLPDKYHGIADEELRMRERYLDILTNAELRDLFIKKSKFWDVTRTFLKERGFLEVETPTIELTTGGAEARPFATHHNDYDLDVFMRISVGELWQKRLMAAGFPKTFEIGRVYRNEGSSPDHLQEFTNCEFYMAYADYNEGMKITQDLYRTIASEVFGTTKFTTRGHTFDLADEWIKIDYTEEIIKQTGININEASDDEIKAKLHELHVKYDGVNRERLIDTLWKYCRKNISGPAFLINHPVIVAPLAKMNADGKTVQQFQPILGGSEVGRGYSELNDPIDQRKRFEVQQELIKGGDEEAMMADWEFVEMLEHGMPPTCGYGFGERLFAFLADRPIREVTLFPLVKPKDSK
jgi:lysyl-tRNA synthetase class 2